MAAVRRWNQLGHRHFDNFWLLFVERNTAAPAKTIGCAKLNQKAMVAPDNLPGIDRGKSSGHLQVGVARAGKPRNPYGSYLLCVMCGMEAVEVKGNSSRKNEILRLRGTQV